MISITRHTIALAMGHPIVAEGHAAVVLLWGARGAARRLALLLLLLLRCLTLLLLLLLLLLALRCLRAASNGRLVRRLLSPIRPSLAR